MSIFLSFGKYLGAHKLFIWLSQLTHELALLITLECKHSAAFMGDHLLGHFSVKAEFWLFLTSGKHTKPVLRLSELESKQQIALGLHRYIVKLAMFILV